MSPALNPTLGLFIMMNNYFHDVATALLAASGVALWVMMKRYEDGSGEEATQYFLSIYKGMTRLARFSLYWILLGGVPRTIFYRDFEWSNAVGHGQIPALIVKHILAFAFVGTGVYVWIKLNRKVKFIMKGAR